MNQSKHILMAAFAALVLMVGCNKKEDNKTGIAGRTARSGTPAAQAVTAAGAAGTGYIYTSNQYASQFSTAMKYLASASIADMESIGDIAVNGVRLWGRVELDAGGNLIPGASAIAIEINDSFTGQTIEGQTAPAIRMTIPAQTGQSNGSQATVTFADGFGSVTLTGVRSGQYFQGEMSFVNLSNDHAGAGFSFYIPYCGFFRC